MTASEIFDHVATLENEVKQLRSNQEKCVDVTRFSGVWMTTDEVARFLGMRPSTVRNYAHLGLIAKHPKCSDGKMYFEASIVLKMTYNELKAAKRRLKWNLKNKVYYERQDSNQVHRTR